MAQRLGIERSIVASAKKTRHKMENTIKARGRKILEQLENGSKQPLSGLSKREHLTLAMINCT